MPAFRPEYASGLSFGQSLGAAGEQFIEQTPWANPNHPSHHIHRQHAHREANLQPTYAGPSSGPRRHAGQPGGMFSSNTSIVPNGDASAQVPRMHVPVAPENFKGAKVAPDALRRESAIHAS